MTVSREANNMQPLSGELLAHSNALKFVNTVAKPP